MTTQLAERREWLEQRRAGIGGSDIAGVLGVSPWASPWSIFADKTGLAPLDDDGTDEMNLGRDLEPIIARWFHARTGLYVAGEQMMIHDRHGDPFFATVDGLVIEPGTDDLDLAAGIFEAKYSADAPWETPPEHYVLQVQWAMHCAGLDRAWIAAMHLPFGRPRFEVYEIERDDDLIAEATAAARGFWDDHVATGIPPDADAHRATTAAIAGAWVDTARADVVDLDEIRDVVDTLVELRAAAKALDGQITLAENTVKAHLAEATEGHLDGASVLTWRPQSRAAYEVAAATFRVLRINDRRKP